MILGRGFANFVTKFKALTPAQQKQVYNGARSKWLSAKESERVAAIGVGTRLGHSEDPERNTYDGHYNGTPGKDKPLHDFYYREPIPHSTHIDRTLSKFITALMWFWFTYHMYYHSGLLFGHWYMPYLSEFTDQELGIPKDSEADPEYWGNHGKKYGTYR
uniref:NADH dehydrogenase [ubiquinone] 1 beta subcomplex subunit 2, mitochondrial n=1 Tax=Rhabditophanes sp. KR3021 TaxID=114890 RepID=A0AC35TUN1_9BILA